MTRLPAGNSCVLASQNIEYCISIVHGNELCIVFSVTLATLKPTKTRRIMMRCNTCSALVFVNGILSQQRIETLRDFRFTPMRGMA